MLSETCASFCKLAEPGLSAATPSEIPKVLVEGQSAAQLTESIGTETHRISTMTQCHCLYGTGVLLMVYYNGTDILVLLQAAHINGNVK